MQKCVSSQFKDNIIATTFNPDLAQVSNRRFCLTFRGTKGAEIMLACQGQCSLLHRRNIQALVYPADVISIERRSHRLIKQKIVVAPLECAVACMKGLRDDAHPLHGNSIRQMCVNTTHPRGIGARDITVKMHHLCCGVDACIRPAGANGRHTFGGDGR